jgi:molybdopterin-guanine dinucleotide biosynthesis protein A
MPEAGAGGDAAGFVLAGGQSSRMGKDKALVEFAGQPLVVRALGILRQAGLVASIAGARSELAECAPVVDDLGPNAGQGPLSGICSALAACSAGHAVFLPVDLPLLPPSLIVYLLLHARVSGSLVTVPTVNGFAQTFPAVVDRAALAVLQGRLTGGDRGCFSAFQAVAAKSSQPVSVLPVELLVQSGHVSHSHGLPAALWFLNVNSEKELARAEALAADGYRVS